MTLVSENRSGERIGYDRWFHDLERLPDEGWDAAAEQEGRICTVVLHMGDSGESAHYDASLLETHPPSGHRIRIALQLMERGGHRASGRGPI